VLGEGNRAGRSCPRASVRKIHSMPSKTGQCEIGFGPSRGEACSSGNPGAIIAHGVSVSADGSLAIHGMPFAAYGRAGVPIMPPSVTGL